MQGSFFNDPRRRRRGLICCHCENPFSNGIRRCKDPDGTRFRLFRERCRDCYWPLFTHPGWLSCNRLYCCCPRNVREITDPDRRRERDD